MAVGKLEFCFLQEFLDRQHGLYGSGVHGKETTFVPARVLVISFALLLVSTKKWSRRILNSQCDLTF